MNIKHFIEEALKAPSYTLIPFEGTFRQLLKDATHYEATLYLLKDIEDLIEEIEIAKAEERAFAILQIPEPEEDPFDCDLQNYYSQNPD